MKQIETDLSMSIRSRERSFGEGCCVHFHALSLARWDEFLAKSLTLRGFRDSFHDLLELHTSNARSVGNEPAGCFKNKEQNRNANRGKRQRSGHKFHRARHAASPLFWCWVTQCKPASTDELCSLCTAATVRPVPWDALETGHVRLRSMFLRLVFGQCFSVTASSLLNLSTVLAVAVVLCCSLACCLVAGAKATLHGLCTVVVTDFGFHCVCCFSTSYLRYLSGMLIRVRVQAKIHLEIKESKRLARRWVRKTEGKDTGNDRIFIRDAVQ